MSIGETFGAIGGSLYSAGSTASNAIYSGAAYVANGAGQMGSWVVTFAKTTVYPALASVAAKVGAFAAGIFAFFQANPPAFASLIGGMALGAIILKGIDYMCAKKPATPSAV